jgi:putative PIG3 family NAD(P)H quinone oxidoreductase
MKAIVAPEPGGPEVLRLVDREDPRPGDGDLLVRVEAAGVNRADALQRHGRYPPPPGASDVLGLEIAGRVEAIGPRAGGWAVGDRVCSILAGGGYAELAAVPASTALPWPDGAGAVDAAAAPEAFLTAWDNLIERGRPEPGETVLIHGGSSGVGTAAIQLARREGCRVLVTAGSPAKLAACAELGADAGVDYREEDFVAWARAATRGTGVDVVLDLMGAAYLDRNLRVLADDGRLVVIGTQGGSRAELDIGRVLRHRLTIAGSTLRARPLASKAALTARVRERVWPGFADGSLRTVVDRTFPLAEAARAHELLESSTHIGKIVLTV